jgi:hypothetical protein
MDWWEEHPSLLGGTGGAREERSFLESIDLHRDRRFYFRGSHVSDDEAREIRHGLRVSFLTWR